MHIDPYQCDSWDLGNLDAIMFGLCWRLHRHRYRYADRYDPALNDCRCDRAGLHGQCYSNECKCQRWSNGNIYSCRDQCLRIHRNRQSSSDYLSYLRPNLFANPDKCHTRQYGNQYALMYWYFGNLLGHRNRDQRFADAHGDYRLHCSGLFHKRKPDGRDRSSFRLRDVNDHSRQHSEPYRHRFLVSNDLAIHRADM